MNNWFLRWIIIVLWEIILIHHLNGPNDQVLIRLGLHGLVCELFVSCVSFRLSYRAAPSHNVMQDSFRLWELRSMPFLHHYSLHHMVPQSACLCAEFWRSFLRRCSAEPHVPHGHSVNWRLGIWFSHHWNQVWWEQLSEIDMLFLLLKIKGVNEEFRGRCRHLHELCFL